MFKQVGGEVDAYNIPEEETVTCRRCVKKLNTTQYKNTSARFFKSHAIMQIGWDHTTGQRARKPGQAGQLTTQSHRHLTYKQSDYLGNGVVKVGGIWVLKTS